MNQKEKIQEIFRNNLTLILEYNKINHENFSKFSEQTLDNFININKEILNINSQFSNYQLRPDYDKDPEYLERIKQQEKDLVLKRKELNELKENFEFNIGQTKLDANKLDSLLKEINFLIDDL